MSKGKVVVQGGVTGVAVAVTGVATGALSAATVIVASGGAFALVLIGFGLYKKLSPGKTKAVAEHE